MVAWRFESPLRAADQHGHVVAGSHAKLLRTAGHRTPGSLERYVEQR
jgi:hypothetical protein